MPGFTPSTGIDFLIPFRVATKMESSMIINLKPALLIACIVTVSTSCLANHSVASSQTMAIETDQHSGHAVVTESGTITAMHVGGIDHDYVAEDMDIVIDTRSKSGTGFKTSDLPPDYFIDRRGRRHTLSVIGNLDSQTIVSMMFFPGESGMPIFASDGSVTCIVLGNVFIRGRWYGRVARVTPIVEFAERRRCIRTRRRALR